MKWEEVRKLNVNEIVNLTVSQLTAIEQLICPTVCLQRELGGTPCLDCEIQEWVLNTWYIANDDGSFLAEEKYATTSTN